MLASVADVVIEVDPDNTFRWVSPSVAQVLGWDPEELVGKSAVDIVHSEDLGELIQTREHPVDGVADGTYRVRTGRGVYRWMSGQSREVRDRGRLLGRVVTLRDVDEQVRARQALADSEARYRLLAENSSDVVFEGGNDGRVRWVSQSVTDLLGWTPDELVGATFRHLVHPDDLPRVMEVQRGLLEGEPGRMRIRVRTVTGDFRWFDCSIRPVFDDSGNVIGRVGGWRDVQAEQVAQESLRVSEAKYRLIAENVGDVVITTAPDLTVTWVSPALPRLSGWTSSDILGRSVRDFVHLDDVDALTAALSDLQRGGVESVTMRARFRHRDGSYQHWSVVSRLADGKAGAGLVVSLRNVNDEVKAERLSVAAEQRYRALVNDSADALVVADGTGRITFASPAVSTILGWDPADLVGMVVMDDLVHPDDRAGAVAAREALLADGVGRYRARLRHPDTRYSWVEANISVTRGPDGGLVGTTATWRDIDAEVSAKQRAGEQEARRQAVLDSMLDPHVLLTALRDKSGTIVDFVYADANDAACVYNQLPREQLVGTSLLELLPGHAGTGLFAQYCHTVQTGEPLVLDDYVYPHEILAEPRHFDIRGVKVGDALSFTWRDVTERSAAEERLAASEARYRMLVDRVAHVTVVADSQAVVQFVSNGVVDLLGYDPNELIGIAIPELVHVEDQQDAQEYRTRLLRTGGSRYRGRLRCRDGTYRWVETTGEAQYAQDGSVTGVIGVWRDATLANDSEVIAEHVGDPVFRITHGTITWASPSVTRQFGGTHGQWLGMTWGDRVHPDDLPTFLEATRPVGGGRAAQIRVRMLGLERAQHWVDMTVTPTAEPGVWVVSVHLVDEDVAREQSLKRLAGSDSLTGLSNRRDLLMRLAAVLSKRRKGQLTGLLFCDLDNLKSINDRAGHAAGDTVISTVAQRIQHLVRRDDICARFGGDEFVIVLVGLHNLRDAIGIADKIRLAATTPVAVTDGQTVNPSLSIGVTLARDGEDVSDLIARADTAMYQAKDSGRNAVAAL